jgi:2',3'-cyclic-nucleotide 2'-phosphodiesterase (5'-nucleotidase family)
LVEQYQKEVGQKLDVVIATATQALRRDRYQESMIGNWMTDCTRTWTKTQIAFHNSGGIRADLPKGPVTLRDIFNIMPFDNAVLTLRMKGRAIRDILEHALGGSIGMIQVSGISFRYKADAPNGRRVKQVWVGDEPLKERRLYSVSAVDFLVQGGDGYSAFDSARDRVHTGVLLRDVLSWCAQEHSPIRPAALGRMVPVGKD